MPNLPSWSSSTTCAFWASDINTGEMLVRADPALRRPVEVQCLLGDDTQARHLINWSPTTSFHVRQHTIDFGQSGMLIFENEGTRQRNGRF